MSTSPVGLVGGAVSWRIDPFVRALMAGEVMRQANYGDGEWGYLTGEVQENRDQRYSPEFGAAIAQTLIEPRFTHFGTNPGRRLYASVRAWLRGRRLNSFTVTDSEVVSQPGPINWVHKECLPAANVRGEIGPLWGELRKHRVVLVGPEHICHNVVLPGIVAFVAVPFPDAFDNVDQIERSVAFRVIHHAADVVLFSAGMTTNVLMWRLCGMDTFDGITMLDTGALFDPYYGVLSRKRYEAPEWQDAKRRALKEADAWT